MLNLIDPCITKPAEMLEAYDKFRIPILLTIAVLALTGLLLLRGLPREERPTSLLGDSSMKLFTGLCRGFLAFMTRGVLFCGTGDLGDMDAGELRPRNVTALLSLLSGVIFSLLMSSGDRGDTNNCEGDTGCRGALSFHLYS